jgi:hypothetical protein
LPSRSDLTLNVTSSGAERWRLIALQWSKTLAGERIVTAAT